MERNYHNYHHQQQQYEYDPDALAHYEQHQYYDTYDPSSYAQQFEEDAKAAVAAAGLAPEDLEEEEEELEQLQEGGENKSSEDKNKSEAKVKKPKAPKIQIVRSEIKPTGEAIQVVRPLATTKESSEAIVKKLINQYGTRPAWDQSELTDFNMVKTAFPNVAGQILNAYEGAQLMTDSKQDLVGEKYLAEQIKMVNEENKKKSILDKWSHLLYEGEDERSYQTAATITSPFYAHTSYTPINTETFTINGAKFPAPSSSSSSSYQK